MSKIGELFQDASKASRNDIMQAEKDFDWVVEELVPELKGTPLSMQSTLDVITQIMEQIAPEENKELEEKGVQFNDDPKGKEKNG